MSIYEFDKRMTFYEYDKRTCSTVMANAHFHNYHELYFLEHGETKYFIGDKIFFLKEGDIAFIPKEIFHKTNNENSTFIERHILYFPDLFVNETYLPYLEELKGLNHVSFPSGHIHRITDLLKKIAHEDKYRQKGYEEMQKLYLQQLLILISRFRNADIEPPSDSLHIIIQEAVTYIAQNVCADLCLPVLAAKYNVSPNYFSKQFKSITGIGLNEYINIARITAAEKLLKTTKKPITQIALECGFNDSNYFAAVFKKLKGVTPKKYSMQN